MSLPPEGFLLECSPGRVVVGEGPLEPRPSRRPDAPACYAPDFFRCDPSPWLHPARWRETSRDALRREIGALPAPAVSWTAPDRDAYAAAFAEVQRRIAEGTLLKAVPIVIEHGALATGDGLAAHLVARALDHSGPTLAYAVWSPAGGMVGSTPEILFRRGTGTRVETVAMAGTYPIARADALPEDPKESREHESVVDDIVAALAPLGTVSVGDRDVVRLATMAHLHTPIGVELGGPTPFATLVDALHPTAALGVAPRAAGLDVLRTPGAADRGRFGAPVGIEWPDGAGTALVAIRNLQWEGTAIRLAVGAGVIAESRLEREWDELTLKRESVKDMFGL